MLTCIPGVVACAFIKVGSYSQWTGPDIWLRTEEIVMMQPHVHNEEAACIVRIEQETRPIISRGSCDRLAERIAKNG